MLNNIHDILTATGDDILQPLSFGSQTGKTLLEIPPEYWAKSALQFGYDVMQFTGKVDEAKRHKANRESIDRPVVTSMLQMREWLYDLQQKDFVLKFGQSNYGGLIASIGSGKTYAIAELIRLRWMKGKDKCLIVVSPVTVIGSFYDGLTEYFNGKASISIITGTKVKDSNPKLEAINEDANFYITNPETIRDEFLLQELKNKGFTWIICDEAHLYLINHESATVKAMMELSANIQMRFVMTGTPRRKSDLDFFQLVTFLDRGKRFGTSFYKFRTEWFIKSFNGYDYFLNPRLVEKFKSIIAELFHYVSKEDALKGLPPLVEESIEVELSGESLTAYKDMHKESVIELKEYFDYLKFLKTIPKEKRTKEQNEQRQVMAVNAGVRILRLRQISSGFVSWNDFEDNDEVRGIVNFNKDKIKALDKLLNDIDEPVVIGAWFRQEIEDIEKLLKSKKLKYGVISGAISAKKKGDAKKDFIGGKLDVIILQIRAGGTGLDGLQKVCNKMILYSRDYSWYSYEQIKGRIERRGQERSMLLLNLMAVLPNRKKTIDMTVMNSIKERKEAFKEIVGDTSSNSGGNVLKDIMMEVIKEG